MKFLFTFSIIVCCVISGFSQEIPVSENQTTQNSVYGNLGFNPEEFYIPLSVNYEYTLYNVGFAKINGRTGVGFWLAWTEKGIDFPVTGQIVFFKKSSHIEIGIGAQYIYDFADNMTGLSHLMNIAYRFQKPNGKFLFKIGIEKNKWQAYPFISTGCAF
ncbi:MAG: hypothetical protein GXO80_04980 [Chlorobi bacterium]|nr:hypothetical protein [Chlorobiota bacterium]